MDLQAYNQHILDLAQKWIMCMMTEVEYKELDKWFRALEDNSLGTPTEINVDRVELRLHQQLYNNIKPKDDGESLEAPPPWQ
ncbi:MAG: hypothetical protein NVS3B13_40570 [Mucilaginibacter sp.]